MLVHFINLLGFLFWHYAKIASPYSRIMISLRYVKALFFIENLFSCLCNGKVCLSLYTIVDFSFRLICLFLFGGMI